MLLVKYIDEPAVLAELLAAREKVGAPACGGAEGFVVTDGPRYLGHILFCAAAQGGSAVTTVLDASLNGEAEPEALDLAVRACVAAGQRRGCERFCVDMGSAALARWWRGRFGAADAPQPANALLGCAGPGA